MPSPETNIVQAVTKAVQYTGSNSADIDAQVPNVTITSEVGGVLELLFNGSTVLTLNTGDWIYWNGFVTNTLSNSMYLGEWGCVALCSDVDALQTEVATLQTEVAMGAMRSFGVAPVPALLLNQSTTIGVQLNPAMPNASYSAYALLFAGTVSITGLQINSVTVVDADTVNVVVQSVGVATLAGANVMVHAVD